MELFLCGYNCAKNAAWIFANSLQPAGCAFLEIFRKRNIRWITQAEFSRGALYKGVSPEKLQAFYQGFLLLALDQQTIDRYCELWGSMARTGNAPDYPDLWIAACAASRGVPVLTRNKAHFEHVPGLSVVSYKLADKTGK